MKNREKFKDEIVDIACKGGTIAVAKTSYEPVDCNSIECATCLFYGCGGCSEALIEWARREYKKPAVISCKDILFLDFIKDNYEYIARDKDGSLFAYVTTPKKYQDRDIWLDSSGVGLYNFNIDFPMIKWEDEQPRKISDLKKLKVVEKY